MHHASSGDPSPFPMRLARGLGPSLGPDGAAAQEDDVYYHHVDPNYWWYLSQNPSFELAVTSQGRRYITHDVLGEREVTIDYALGGPLFKVGGLRLGAEAPKACAGPFWSGICTFFSSLWCKPTTRSRPATT